MANRRNDHHRWPVPRGPQVHDFQTLIDMALRSNLILAGLSAIVAIAILETALRLLTPYPITEDSNKSPHPKLGYVLSSDFPDIDVAGFRNPSQRLADAHIAVIGDSHTYGENVETENNYPSILAELTDQPVYNLGVSSYGIYQYHVLLGELLDSPVDTVVVSLFTYNDLALYCAATTTAFWQQEAQTLGIELPDCRQDDLRGRLATSSPGNWLRSTATWQLLWTALRGASGNLDKSMGFTVISSNPEKMMSQKLIDLVAERGTLTRPDISLNFANSKIFFSEARKKYAAENKQLMFVLIPSSLLAIMTRLTEKGATIDPSFATTVNELQTIRKRYIEFFEREGIDYVDALPFVTAAMRATAKDQQQFYWGSHPKRAGYEAYARAVASGLNNRTGDQ
ncbi:MAG: SGNH/GDSL hydrolase family protein [Gammaproteobacteria bacterium]